MKTIYVRDFGAIPNDNRSDQLAFNAAANYINKKKGNVKLIISEGTYLVGPNYNFTVPVKDIPRGKVWDVINLANCSNVTIEAKGNTLIKFLDNIPVGTVPLLPAPVDSAVHVGSLLRLTECRNINIININGYGNNEKFRLLNKWGAGANPYEREHDGLFILNCADVAIKNSKFTHFVRDGSMILEDQDRKLKVKNISFINCIFNNNGRNGMSWCGGENVVFNNCQFNFNSTGKIKSNPAVGIDIEPERGAVCKNGRILNSVMSGNGGYCMGSVYKESSDVIFDNCKFTGSVNYAFIIQSPGFAIKNSTIAGTAMFTFDSDNEHDGTVVSNCKFTDSLKNEPVYIENYLLAVKGRFTSFLYCTFDSYKSPSVYTEITKKRAKADKENTLFKNCVFNAKFKKNATWGKHAFLLSNSNFLNCVFNSEGFADFKTVLKLNEKNNYQENSRFIN